jgi:hypothetical protein
MQVGYWSNHETAYVFHSDAPVTGLGHPLVAACARQDWLRHGNTTLPEDLVAVLRITRFL